MLVGYMGVSSDSDRQTTDLQRDALLSAGVDSRHLFEDHASGTKDDRCGLAKALEFVKSSDVLVVWKLDRLGRSLSHLLSIVNELKDRQVAFRSLTEGMDTPTASGELLFHVFGARAQYERALTRERVMAGLTAARRCGRVGGRPPVIVGEKLDAILAALDDGMSKAAVCRNFGVSVLRCSRRWPGSIRLHLPAPVRHDQPCRGCTGRMSSLSLPGSASTTLVGKGEERTTTSTG